MSPPARSSTKESVFATNWKTILATIPVLFTCIAMVEFIDERYAHATDVGRQVITLSDQLETDRLVGEISVLEIRKSSLEDKVYDTAVRFKGRLEANSPDAIIQDRYLTELQSISKRIAHKLDLIDQIKLKASVTKATQK